MNSQIERKVLAKKPLPKMKSLKNTGALAVAGGGNSVIGCVTGPACGATQIVNCSKVSVNNCPNG